MKLKKILAFALCLACFLTSSVFANSAVTTGSIVEDATQEITESDEWVEAMSDLEELSTDDLLSIAQTTPVDYYESNTEVGGAVNRAASINNTNATEDVKDITFQENWATYDYDTVPDWAKENVLIARYSIVFNCQDISWSVDDSVKIINEDGSLEDVPIYSDLFPYWDLEQLSEVDDDIQDDVTIDNASMKSTKATMSLLSTDSNKVSNMDSTMSLLSSRYELQHMVEYDVPKATSSNAKVAFGHYCQTNWNSIGLWAGQLYKMKSYNVSGQVGMFGKISYKVNLVADQGLRVYNAQGSVVHFRISTYSTPGTGWFSVDYEK